MHGNVTTQPLQWHAEEIDLRPSKSKFSCTFEEKKKRVNVVQHTVNKFHVSTAIIRMTKSIYELLSFVINRLHM